MNPYIDYFVVREKVKEGRTLVGVDPAIARRFYCAPSFSEARQTIEEPVPAERIAVMFPWVLSHVSISVSVILAVVAFKWWGILIVPPTAIWWVWNVANASMGRPALWPWIVAAFAWPYLVRSLNWSDPVRNWGLSLILVPLLTRITYRIAASLFTDLILRNRRAFALFRESAIFTKDSPNQASKPAAES